MKNMKRVSIALLAIILSLSAVGCGDKNMEGVNTGKANKAGQEEVYDVVVIGAGGAGLSAAIEIKGAGASVVVLEKMAFIGGNTLISGGELNAPETWIQEKLGIEDSIDLYKEDTLKGGDHQADEKLVTVLANNARQAVEWLRDTVNVSFKEDYLMQFGGHSVPRAAYPQGGSGNELIGKLGAKAEEMNIPVRKQTKAEEILADKDGKVNGVRAVDKDGNEIIFKANKGVIVATGGFGANVEMRKQYNSEYDERYMETVQPSSTGDGIIMAQKLGAALVGMENIQTYPTCNPATGILSYVADTRFNGAVLINKEGNRFVEELERRDVISKAILAQTDGMGYLIWDTTIKNNSHMDDYMEEFNQLVAQGMLIKADTIEEVAQFFDINVEQLKQTIEKYNQYAVNGKDEDFNRRGEIIGLTEAPYYLQKVTPAIHHTMGGLKIDTEARVIDNEGNPIPGLFAAGEVTGGIHGTNRLGGNAITDIIVFGRIAAESVLK
ncbi:flavocytochrome c [Alkaliphilus oremlandii]|uniref:Flavocytochrome c n=1 Tax=Alkaliphilus oremlandii (strain OhILAs) TaxID=350688 RepID=A8MKS7_ALKOO|nr:flavocytochrome c [Alkaliphilus oremlandii]ABW17744.1 flavocytochrome c [Alkaliphilus oremlandii OhILAs]